MNEIKNDKTATQLPKENIGDKEVHFTYDDFIKLVIEFFQTGWDSAMRAKSNQDSKKSTKNHQKE